MYACAVRMRAQIPPHSQDQKQNNDDAYAENGKGKNEEVRVLQSTGVDETLQLLFPPLRSICFCSTSC